MNQKQTKITTLAEAEQTEAEAHPEEEEAKEEALEATIAEDSTIITGTIDIEITARRFYLSSWTHPTNLLQAVKGIAEYMEEAQWTEWVMYCAPWTHL